MDQNESVLRLLGRDQSLFEADTARHGRQLENLVENHRFLVIGGAGSIGRAVTLELFKRDPRCLHVVDISENNLVELVRDIRSSYGYIKGDFKTFALDAGSMEYDAFIKQDGIYDYVLNLSALKHVRSEKDPFTLMRMINVNILNTDPQRGIPYLSGFPENHFSVYIPGESQKSDSHPRWRQTLYLFFRAPIL